MVDDGRFRSKINVTSSGVVVQPVVLNTEDDVNNFMATLNSAKMTMYQIRRSEEKLKQLTNTFGGNGNGSKGISVPDRP